MKHTPHQKFFFTMAFCAIFFAPLSLFAATFPAGVPKDALWFSKDPFFAGDTITIFTMVYNSTDYTLSGMMELRDGTTTISKKNFVVDKSGASQVVSFPYEVTPGNHAFVAVITEDELRKEGSAPLDETLTETKTTAMKRFADLDTDHDGIPNIGDTDKDGDGIPDGKDAHPLVKDNIESVVTKATPKENPITAIEEKIKTSVPEPIASRAVPILGSIEGFRVDQAAKAATRVDGARDEVILLGNVGTGTQMILTKVAKVPAGWAMLGEGVVRGDVVKTPFAYVKLFFALVFHFVTSSVIVFYLFILFILFKLVRLTLRFFL